MKHMLNFSAVMLCLFAANFAIASEGREASDALSTTGQLFIISPSFDNSKIYSTCILPDGTRNRTFSLLNNKGDATNFQDLETETKTISNIINTNTVTLPQIQNILKTTKDNTHTPSLVLQKKDSTGKITSNICRLVISPTNVSACDIQHCADVAQDLLDASANKESDRKIFEEICTLVQEIRNPSIEQLAETAKPADNGSKKKEINIKPTSKSTPSYAAKICTYITNNKLKCGAFVSLLVFAYLAECTNVLHNLVAKLSLR